MEINVTTEDQLKESAQTNPNEAIILWNCGAVTLHEMVDDQIGAGYPVSIDDLIHMLAARKRDALTWLPHTALAVSDDEAVWWRPASKATLYFSLSGKQQVVSDVPLPPLVFHLKQGLLKVAAIENNFRPAPQTPLYRAPFMNLNDEGALCFGSVRRESGCHPDTWPKWESCLLETRFTHLGFDEVVNLPDSLQGKNKDALHVRFWKSLQGRTVFPSEYLMPLDLTLSAWCEQ